ncbi:MAG: TetR/AcrR family transcriptional regulator [Deltaproteobacteria bacterium]|nr:TetR/AcrR family transcriptional regulator [Deltaproteobacteria bacterium]
MSISSMEAVNAIPESLPRRDREKLRQRGEILEAALKLFSEKGYHNVSMHEIAREAEFGIGTLYKFFRNKEELYKALITQTAETWNQIFIQVLEHEQDPIQAIKNYLNVRRELFSDNLSLMRLYFAETRGASFNIKAGLDHDLLKLYGRLIDKLASVFEKGVNQNVFRAIDPQDMALALEGTINSFLFRMMEDPTRSRETDNLSAAAEIFFNGVLD